MEGSLGDTLPGLLSSLVSDLVLVLTTLSAAKTSKDHLRFINTIRNDGHFCVLYKQNESRIGPGCQGNLATTPIILPVVYKQEKLYW